MLKLISVLHSVLDSIASFGGAIARKPPDRGRLLPILAVLGNMVLAVSAFGQGTTPRAQGGFDYQLGALTVDPVSLQNQTVIYFACEATEEMEEQGFRDCGEQAVPGFESAPNWTLGLTLNVCPTDNATFIAAHGPVDIKWPQELVMNLEVDESCKAPIWIYYHENWDGSFVGLLIDPKTQRLSVEQSEVTYR